MPPAGTAHTPPGGPDKPRRPSEPHAHDEGAGKRSPRSPHRGRVGSPAGISHTPALGISLSSAAVRTRAADGQPPERSSITAALQPTERFAHSAGRSVANGCRSPSHCPSAHADRNHGSVRPRAAIPPEDAPLLRPASAQNAAHAAKPWPIGPAGDSTKVQAKHGAPLVARKTGWRKECPTQPGTTPAWP